MSSETPVLSEPNAQPKKGFSILSIFSLITGALSYILIFFHSPMKMSFIVAAILAPISSIVAVITGHSSKKQIRHFDGVMGGKKLANAGLILGYIYLGICILLLIGTILGVAGAVSLFSNLVK